jgi:hypothetical protein
VADNEEPEATRRRPGAHTGHRSATSQAGRAEHRPDAEGSEEGPEPRSWWRRWFGFE